MSIEFTGINKDTAVVEIKNFLDSCSEDVVFKMVINSKRGYLRIKIKTSGKSRLKKLFGKLRRKKSHL
ncbi:MAG: hypothetical protein J5U19_11825 [Candidatus Methanoperedens sp.]|nr:hypothetical protein [Candidatus Methanoperedens sp.]MCE8429064.1 hypothetical protein [Candidatus Methanoperedens sp.]